MVIKAVTTLVLILPVVEHRCTQKIPCASLSRQEVVSSPVRLAPTCLSHARLVMLLAVAKRLVMYLHYGCGTHTMFINNSLKLSTQHIRPGLLSVHT